MLLAEARALPGGWIATVAATTACMDEAVVVADVVAVMEALGADLGRAEAKADRAHRRGGALP